MSNSRFVLTNRAIGKTVKNGTGGGAPARDEVGLNVMENALAADRYLPWQATGLVGPAQFDIDLGSAQAVTCGGVHGFRGALAAAGTVDVQYATAYPGGPWSSAGSFSLIQSPRDKGIVFGTQSKRYWRFEIANGATFSIGKLLLGVVTDLGYIHSPGGEYSPFRNRLESQLESGPLVVTDLGDPGADFTLPWTLITQAKRDTLITANLQTGSFSFFDADDNLFEVILRGGRVRTARQINLFDANLELTRLP